MTPGTTKRDAKITIIGGSPLPLTTIKTMHRASKTDGTSEPSTNRVEMDNRVAIAFTELLVGVERIDHHVVPVAITKRELPGSSAGVHVGFLFESGDQSTRPRQRLVKVIDAKEQE